LHGRRAGGRQRAFDNPGAPVPDPAETAWDRRAKAADEPRAVRGMLVATSPRVMESPLPAWQLSSEGTSRRQGPRLEVEAVINGRLSRGSLRLNLVDLGFGGFAVECPIAFETGSRHEFRFVTAATVTVHMLAEAVYSRPSDPSDGMAHYVAGFKYVRRTEQDQRSIDILIDAANSPLQFS
jgi:hypothetical protein